MRSGVRGLAPFFAGNVCFGAGLIVHAFSFNFYLRELGYPAAVMGHQVTALTVGGLLALLPASLLIDRVGTRVTMLGGVSIATIGLVGSALAHQTFWIHAAAVIIGAGGAACRVTWSPALMRLASPEQRARAFTWNVAAVIGSAALWHALAGALPARLAPLAASTGLSGTQWVLIAGAAITALALPCYWRLEFPAPVPAPTPEQGGPAPASGIPVEVRWLLVAITAWMLADDLARPFFNIFFTDRFAMPVAAVGSLFAVALLLRGVGLVGAGEIAKRFGPQRVLTWWLIAAAPCLVALALTRNAAIAMGVFVVHGFIPPATNPLIDQLLLERVRPDRHGVTNGWRNAGAEIAGAAGASAGGHLVDATSFTVLLLASAALAAVTAPILIGAFRWRGARPPGDPQPAG